MASKKPTRSDVDVVVAGIGLQPFGNYDGVAMEKIVAGAVTAALKDASISYSDIDLAYYCHVRFQGISAGQAMFRRFGSTGVPIINLENACSSGTTGLWQAHAMIRTGQAECVLVVGSERVPRGPVQISGDSEPSDFRSLMGSDNAAARYGLKAKKYMHDYGAPREALAQVAVKARANAAINPSASVRKAVTVEEVLNATTIVDPLTKYEVCPNADGAAASVLMSRRLYDQLASDRSRAVLITGVGLASERHPGRTGENPGSVELAAHRAFEMSGRTPADVQIAQIHDAATAGELSTLEGVGLFAKGQAWRATMDGVTAFDGTLPVNTDGGMLGLGHPFGATGLRMLHELALQLRGSAGTRQAGAPDVGVLECAGANGVANVLVLETDVRS